MAQFCKVGLPVNCYHGGERKPYYFHNHCDILFLMQKQKRDDVHQLFCQILSGLTISNTRINL